MTTQYSFDLQVLSLSHTPTHRLYSLKRVQGDKGGGSKVKRHQ